MTTEPDDRFVKRVAIAAGALVAGMAFWGLVLALRPRVTPQFPTIAIPQPPSIALAVATAEELALAKAEVDAYVFEAYPAWASTGGLCPQRLLDVNRFAPRLHAIDPWGTPYQFLCGHAYAFTTRSAGPDRRFDTPDDLVAGK